MRNPVLGDVSKEDILEKCFKYLSEHGLDKVSMRKLCGQTGMGMGSIYYWFDNKDTLILNAAEYGLQMVTTELFDYALEHFTDLEGIMKCFPQKLMQYKTELRFIYQVTTSAQYGNFMRSIANKFDATYDVYTKKISDYMSFDYEQLKPIVYLFISSALDYVIWEDEEKFKTESNFLHSTIKALLSNKDKDGN